MGGNIEEAGKANAALAPIFPIMVLLILLVLVIQIRSLSAMAMVFLTAPLGLVGTVPTLLLFHQPFGFNAILGADRAGRHHHAQHADPDRPDPRPIEEEGWTPITRSSKRRCSARGR